MAKIKQGILGGFSGKVANVVGTSWKGRAVMKSQPLSVANPKTEAQQEQRGKFSKIAELASAVLTQFVQPVENPISGDISGYNLFCKDNKGAFDASGNVVKANFVCGGGKIINIESVDATASIVGSNIAINWTNSEGLSALRLNDKVYAVAVDTDAKNIFVLPSNVTRNDEGAQLERLKGETALANAQKYIMVYAAVSADGRDVSVKTQAIELTLEV